MTKDEHTLKIDDDSGRPDKDLLIALKEAARSKKEFKTVLKCFRFLFKAIFKRRSLEIHQGGFG